VVVLPIVRLTSTSIIDRGPIAQLHHQISVSNYCTAFYWPCILVACVLFRFFIAIAQLYVFLQMFVVPLGFALVDLWIDRQCRESRLRAESCIQRFVFDEDSIVDDFLPFKREGMRV
jgi:hypothetical protein